MQKKYKIGEAAAKLKLKTYVLRFWETEFSQLRPLRSAKGQRLYTEEHLQLLEYIRILLHERGLTLEGARKLLNKGGPKSQNIPAGLRNVEKFSAGEQSCGSIGVAQKSFDFLREAIPMDEKNTDVGPSTACSDDVQEAFFVASMRARPVPLPIFSKMTRSADQINSQNTSQKFWQDILNELEALASVLRSNVSS